MDRELIAMCDCPEIQGKRTAIFGDSIWCEAYNSSGIYMGDGSAELKSGHAVDQETLIHIPRIEDMLEWYGDAKYRLDRCDDGEFYLEIQDEREDFHGEIPLKVLLRGFMYCEHSATWDGETWK